MTESKEERLKALSRQISQYFSYKFPGDPVETEEVIYVESKMNNQLIEEEIIEGIPDYEMASIEKIKDVTYKTKKNYFGTKHLVPLKKTRAKVKKDRPILSSERLPKDEVMNILRKDRKHPLWEKEIYNWSSRDWETLYKLRDEK